MPGKAGDKVACGFPYSHIDGLAGSIVGASNYFSDTKLPDFFDGPVGALAIYNDDFVVTIMLRKNGPQALRYPSLLVLCSDNNGYLLFHLHIIPIFALTGHILPYISRGVSGPASYNPQASDPLLFLL